MLGNYHTELVKYEYLTRLLTGNVKKIYYICDGSHHFPGHYVLHVTLSGLLTEVMF